MPRGRKKKKETRNLNIIVTTLIFLSILLGVLIYSKQGALGKNLSPALGGVLGVIKYFIPIGLFIVAIEIAHEGNTRNYGKKLFMFLVVYAHAIEFRQVILIFHKKEMRFFQMHTF